MKWKFYILSLFLFVFNCTPEKDKMRTDTIPATDFTKVINQQDFPEGPAWDGNNTLYVSNCYGGWITRITSEKNDEFLRSSKDPFTLEKTNGLTVFKDGSIFACDFGIGAILKISLAGKTEVYAAGFAGKRFNRPNDLAFDPNGNLYFTDPITYDSESPDGVIYRIEAGTKEVTRAAKNLAFPNGLAFSADARYLYVCESAKHRVVKFEINQNGILMNPSTFVEMPGGDPDGCNFDQEGNLYVAHFGSSTIWVIRPDGTVREKVKTPGKKPSNVEFGGKDLLSLFVTEAETNCVYKTKVKIPGLKLFSSPEE